MEATPACIHSLDHHRNFSLATDHETGVAVDFHNAVAVVVVVEIELLL